MFLLFIFNIFKMIKKEVELDGQFYPLNLFSYIGIYLYHGNNCILVG